MSWLPSTWAQVWPNFIADIMWAPVAAACGWLYHRHITRLHEKHQAEIRNIVKGESDGGS